MDKLDFPDWLQAKMDERKWTQSILAKHAKVDRQVIWNYLNRKVMKPDENILAAIAEAFDLSPEIVYNIAGIKTSDKKPDESTDRINYLYNSLRKESSKRRAEKLLKLLLDEEHENE